MKFKVLLSSFMFAFVMLFSFGFAGCDNNNYSYKQSQDVYLEIISENPMLFKSTGYVYIRYNNTNIAYPIDEGESELINGQSGAIKLTEKRYNFTKLARYSLDPDTSIENTEAVYEPTLNASMLILATYFKNSGVIGIDNIPKDKLNDLHAKMLELKQAITVLNTQKMNLESKCTGTNFQGDSKVQGALKNYCTAFLDAIDKACATSDSFVDIYSNYIYASTSNEETNTLSPLAVNLAYLSKIVDIAAYYNNFYLYDINEQVKKGPQTAGNEIAIDSEFNWSIYNEYERIKSLETAAAPDADSETKQKAAAIVEMYNVIKSYDALFYANKVSAIASVSTYRNIKDSSNMSTEENIAVDKINEFKNDCKIVKNYFTELTNRIKTFNGV